LLTSDSSRRTNGKLHDSDSATEAGENDRSFGNREPRGEDQSFPPTDRKAPGFAETLRRQFRQLAQSLTRHAPASQPTQHRRRAEETRGGFSLAARQITRRSETLSAAAFAAVAFIPETLDWLNPFHFDSTGNSELDDDYHCVESNHLFPHL
jgi:hypothetical protein